jgi:glycerophosphoryl diester phosphodiesterase
MPVPAIIERGYLRLVDTVFDRLPRSLPSIEQLEKCKIIAHRGIHDNQRVEENTMTAFEHAQKAGVWGIELDIRWTRDLEPVVFHDPDLLRMHGNGRKISTYSLSELKKRYTAIPTLSEVVQQFGGKCHLMIEVKIQPWLDASRQVARLYQILSALEPSKDYHLISFSHNILAPMGEIPMKARIAIAQNWPGPPSRWVKRRQWGGLCGHYFLMRQRLVKAHHQNGQKVGTGYIQSRNCLFREINRGIDWIFSNTADHVQRILDETIDSQTCLDKPR